jgi:hypothetical protein
MYRDASVRAPDRARYYHVGCVSKSRMTTIKTSREKVRITVRLLCDIGGGLSSAHRDCSQRIAYQVAGRSAYSPSAALTLCRMTSPQCMKSLYDLTTRTSTAINAPNTRDLK